MTDALQGKRILVVEDEPLVCMLLEDMLADLGMEVIGPARHLQDALELARSQAFDLAILDVNLDGQRSYAVADVLNRRAVPYTFATGYGEAGLDAAYAGRPVLRKPYRSDDLGRALAHLLAQRT
jgi:CheY-like chemotaxis protein